MLKEFITMNKCYKKCESKSFRQKKNNTREKTRIIKINERNGNAKYVDKYQMHILLLSKITA